MSFVTKTTNRSRTIALLATASALAITAWAGAAQASITINGVTDTVPGTFGTPFNVDNGLFIGTTGTGELDVNSAAQVTVTNCFYVDIGSGAAGVGTLKIDGAGTVFNNGACGALVGEAGTGTLSITNGAVLTTSATNNAVNVVADGSNTHGTVTIDGAGSTWNFADLSVGQNGIGAVTVSNGGTLNQASCSAVNLGVNHPGNGTITITGAGSKWTNTCVGPGNLMNVGSDGTGAINIKAGAVANAGQSVFGVQSDGSGALLVTGAGSQFLSNNFMTIGEGGAGSLQILAGGLVTDSNASVGGLNSLATVDGVGSTWTNNGPLSINAASAAFTISSGGAVTSTVGSDGGSVFVTGAGSRWTIAGNAGSSMSVGGAASGAGVLDISSGGVISDVLGVAGSGANTFAQISIDGAGSAWNNSTTVDFGGGNHSTFSLNITNGGALTSTTGDVETGNVGIHDAGSNWAASGNVAVGSEGIGELSLYDGGTMNIASGTGTLTLGGSGFGTGQLYVGGPSAPAATGDLQVAILNLRTASSFVEFNHTSAGYVFAPAITGIGSLDNEAGVTDLTGISTYTGGTNIDGGSLVVNGALGATSVSVQGGSLGGSGSIGGPVIVHSNSTLVGVAGQTLTMGALTLNSSSNVDVSLGAPSTTQLFQVNGALTLDGDLNIADAGGFGLGLYRLIDYTGALTDNGLVIGTTPGGVSASNLAVQTSVAGQVNLVYSAPATAQFWNGSTLAPTNTVNGGPGTWSVGPTNWTDAPGSTSAAWTGIFGIFMGSAGAVTIDNSGGAVNATGLQFAVDGYSLGGGVLTLTGATPDIRVGDGTAAGANDTATISAPIAGSVGLIKTDLGTLVLSGANTYAGGTTINAGTLSVGADANLGDATNSLTFGGGNLTVTNSLTTDRTFVLGSAATITVNGSASVVGDSGAVTGAGALTEQGAGTFAYSGNGSGFSGALTLGSGGGLFLMNGAFGAGGAVTVDSGGALGGSGTMVRAVDILNGGTLYGVHGQTLTMNSLSLGSNAIIIADFAAPSTNALFQVNGALTLDGLLTVNGGAGFAPGLFRLIDYTGALTDNGLAISAVPAGLLLSDFTVQTSIGGQVNLVYAAPGALQFWNGSTLSPTGSVVGGAGTWSVGPTNWTDAPAAHSGAWPGALAIFSATPGAVTIDNGGGAVDATGLQIAVDGYSVGGGTLTLTGATPTIRVGDGTAAGAHYTASISSVIAGSTGLTKTDLGTLVLSGANTFTGGITLGAGTTSVSTDANLGDPTNVLSFTGGNLTVSQSFATIRTIDMLAGGGSITVDSGVSFHDGGALGAASNLTKLGAGTFTFTGAGGYDGAIAIDDGAMLLNGALNGGGSVTVNSGGTLGGSGHMTGAVDVTDGGALAGLPGQTLTMGSLSLTSNAIIDANLGAPTTTPEFQVNGALVLDGDLNVFNAGGFGVGLYRLIDYTGALTDNGLTIGTTPAGVAASELTVQTSVAGQVNLIYASSPLQFWNGSTFAPTGSVVGGAGTWTASSTNWTDSTGATSAGWGGVDGVFTGAPGAITIDNSAGAINANMLQFAVDGYSLSGGTLTLTGAAPTIRVGDGTLAGAGYTATIASVLAGSGGLTKTDLGTLVLTGANTFTGGLILQGGTLSVGADANLGDATNGVVFSGGALAATASFTSNRLIDLSGPGAINTGAGVTLTLTNSLSGAGNFDKTGAGVLDLEGTSSYNGISSIDAGVLEVNGVIAGATIVQSGARLQGAGTVGGVDVASSGTLAPGNGVGTLSMTGGLTFEAGSTYEVQLNPSGQSSLTHTTSSVTTSGGTVTALSAPGAYSLGTQYTIVTADGGGSGAFTGLTQNLNQPFLQLSLAYDANDVFLDVTRNSASFCSVAATRNQCASANGAESLGVGNTVYDAIANLPTAASAQGAFDSLSGEVNASVRGVELEDSRFVRDAAIDRLRGFHDESRATWAQVFGAQGSTSGDGNAAGLTRTVGGFLMGADEPIGTSWRMGVLGGYSQTRFSVGARDSSGSSDDYHLATYAGVHGGDLTARFGAAYSWHDITTTRGVMFPGFADVDKGAGRSGDGQVFGEVAAPMTKGGASFEPFAGVALVWLHSNGFTETGGASALHDAHGDTQTSFATVGLRGETQGALDGAPVTLRGSVAWRGAYGDVTPNAREAFSPGGAAFTVDGAPIAKDALVVNADLGVKVSPRARLSLGYAGQLSSTAHDDAVKAGLTIAF